MNASDFELRELDASHSSTIVELAHLLNPSVSKEELAHRLGKQWGKDGYYCLGFFRGDTLIGMSSAWITVRLYGGKLVELDNVIIAPDHRGGGTGSALLEALQNWARDRECRRMELKTYLTNDRSHKFYFRHGFDIRAFYFVKQLLA